MTHLICIVLSLLWKYRYWQLLLPALSKLRYAFRHNIITRFEYFFGLSTTNITEFTVTFNSAFYFLLLCTLCYMDNRFMDKNNVQPSEECNQEVFFQVILWCTPFSDWLLNCTYMYVFWGYANDYRSILNAYACSALKTIQITRIYIVFWVRVSYYARAAAGPALYLW